MKRLTMTLALTCVLSFSALAGEMPTCGITSEEPTTTETAAPGNVPTDGLAEQESTNSALTVLLNILSLLAW